MIDETQVQALRDFVSEKGPEAVSLNGINPEDLLYTLETLWRIARAARKWTLASPGQDSVQAEHELMKTLTPLNGI